MKKVFGSNGEFARGKLFYDPNHHALSNTRTNDKTRDIRRSSLTNPSNVDNSIPCDCSVGMNEPTRRFTTAKFDTQFFSRPKL